MQHLHGVTTIAAIEEAGISKDRLPQMPEFERVGHGTYGMRGARRDFWFWAARALLIAGPDARLTGWSALYALGVLKEAPATIHVVVDEGKGSRKEAGFDVRRSRHLPETVLEVNGLRTVPVAHALTDHGRDVRDPALAFAISSALALRRTTLREIQAVRDERGRFPGSKRLRRVLGDFDGVESHSARERALRRALVRRQVPIHPGSYDILGPSGGVIGQSDIAVVVVRLDIQVDGPHHDEAAQKEKDRRRDRRLAGIDWQVVRYSIYEIDADVEKVADEIATLVRRLLDGHTG